MPSPLKCVIIDDELLALSYLRTLCGEIPGVEIVKAYNDPQKLLSEIDSLDIDFYISDIVMPAMNGLELAEKLRNLPVIFTTAHNEFAADAFDVDAVDYLRKPVKKERLLTALEKIRKLPVKNTGPQVLFTTAKGKMLVSPEDIGCISAETLDRRDKLLVLRSGEELVIKNYSFEQLTALLPAGRFIRVSRKDLLSKSVIRGHSSGTIFSSLKTKEHGERQFALGDNYRREFLESFG